MTNEITAYLALYNESAEEKDYISGLVDQFEIAKSSESYHLALFAQHLLFICFFYQVFHKIKLWLPEKQYLSVINFSPDRRKQFREATGPVDYAHKDNKEKPMFEFLNIFKDCEDVVLRCKKLVEYRNGRLGHVNYLLVSQDAFESQINEYEKVAELIHQITCDTLVGVFDSYVASLDQSEEFTKDDLELGLIVRNRLSYVDLEKIYVECQLRPDPIFEKIKALLGDNWGIGCDVGAQIANLIIKIKHLQSGIQENSNLSEIAQIQRNSEIAKIMKKVEDLQNKLNNSI